jgi:hypothetical protein
LNDFGNLLPRITIRLHDQTARNDKIEAMRDGSLRRTGLGGR